MVLTRLNRILAIDPVNRLAVVEPGVVNVRLSAAAAPHGLYYSPDPSSQTACTIGGEGAGKPRGAPRPPNRGGGDPPPRRLGGALPRPGGGVRRPRGGGGGGGAGGA